MTSLWRLFCILAVSSSLASSEDLLGIHGFVKVGTALSTSKDSDVKLTHVNVEVYTPNGVRLMETDCAPNGYFFVPLNRPGVFALSVRIRDWMLPVPGRYIVKPKGFQGWSFTPIQKAVECTASGCNAGHDVIFEVKGFSIHGKIQAQELDGCIHQQHQALDSITVKLFLEGTISHTSVRRSVMCCDESGGEELIHASCAEDGSFSFDSVMPGDYRVFAVHPKWQLMGPVDGIPVQLGWESMVLESTYTVQGFTLEGKVAWKQSPIENISIHLYSSERGGTKAEIADMKPLTSTKTDALGSFSFDGIPCGKYTIVPQFEFGDGMKYGFAPREAEVVVPLGDKMMDRAIEVSSFSVLGSVVHKETVKGVEEVKVMVNAMTNGDGSFVLHDIGEAAIDLDFVKEGMVFERKQGLEFSPFHHSVPTVHPSAYSVCGSVVGKQDEKQPTYRIQLTHRSGNTEMKDTDENGDFCLVLKPGDYTLEVKSSVMFAPKSRKIQVTDSQLANIKFVQKKVNLGVSVKKLHESDWGDVTCILKTADKEVLQTMALNAMTLQEDKDVYSGTFTNISPQEYRLEIHRDGWCWKENVMNVTLGEDDFEAPAFQQVGLVKKLKLTHDSQLRFNGPGTEFLRRGFYEKGIVHRLCFSSAELHIANAEERGCFIFNKDMIIDPTDSATMTISASGFKAKGKVILPSDLSSAELIIRVKSKTTGYTQDIPASKGMKRGEMTFEFTGILGEKHEVLPIHETLLFNPEKLDYSHSGTECPTEMQPFWAKHGTFIAGSISPPVIDANVQLVLKGVSVDQAKSSASGSFSFGPYYDIDTDSFVTVEKQGYEFSISKTDENTFSVASVKLVKVEVAISIKKQDKSGVLVALAGSRHEHRSNAQTNKNGMVSFWKLPADSYYIKPMLKEYEFEPPFMQIDVDGTADERVEFTAERKGFSVFGNVTSLNSQGVADVSILARSSDDDESCLSDENGQFRLQNLKPSVEYTISVLMIGPVRASWPSSVQASITLDSTLNDYADLTGINFVVFKDDGTVNVNGAVDVDADHMSSTEIQVLKTVRSDGGTRLVDVLRPYFNGWFEIDLSYPGKYTFKVINKELETNCQMPSRTIALDAHSPREIYVDEMTIVCDQGRESENVDYERAAYWPVLVTLLAILIVPFRGSLRGLLTPAE